MKKIIYLLPLLLITIASCTKKNTGNTLVNDSLTSSTKGWSVQNNLTDTFQFSQGHYEIVLDQANELTFAAAPYAKLNFPYTVQVDGIIQLQDTSGGKMGAITLVFNHVDTANYARVELWSSGTYRVIQKTNSVFDTIADFTSSSFINAGNNAKNTIEVVQNSTSMNLMVNGTLINTFAISLPSSIVAVGPGLTTGKVTYTPTTGWFNNFLLTKN